MRQKVIDLCRRMPDVTIDEVIDLSVEVSEHDLDLAIVPCSILGSVLDTAKERKQGALGFTTICTRAGARAKDEPRVAAFLNSLGAPGRYHEPGYREFHDRARDVNLASVEIALEAGVNFHAVKRLRRFFADCDEGMREVYADLGLVAWDFIGPSRPKN